MTDDAIRAAVESADTYQAAAVALDMQYPKLYAAARKLGVKPKSIAAKKPPKPPTPERAPAAPTLHDPTRRAAPEPKPPTLGPWIPPGRVPAKRDVVLVRLDQAGRIRAEISDLPGDHWCAWAVHDVTGAIVGKMGICGGLHMGEGRRKAEEGADAALVARGWLPADHQTPTHLCETAAAWCAQPGPPPAPSSVDPIVALAERLLAVGETGLGAELARLVMARATEMAA